MILSTLLPTDFLFDYLIIKLFCFSMVKILVADITLFDVTDTSR